MTARTRTSLLNALLILGSVLVTLSVAEVALRILHLPRETLKPDRVFDPVLMYHMPSDYPGIDSAGFRNPGVPDTAEIVTIGDSHTFGNNAEMSESWPYQFSGLTGKTVYNLGVGGYGPLQYYYLLDKALSLKPRHIILGLYLANDLKGVCSPWQATEYWKERAANENLNLAYCSAADSKDYGDEQPAEQENNERPLLDIFASSRLALLSDNIAYIVKERFGKPDTSKNLVVDLPRNKTLISLNRLRAHRDFLNPSQPEIANSLKVTEELIFRMADRSRQQGIEFVVLFIPSKQTVYHAYLKRHGFDLDQTYEDTVKFERLQKSTITASLKQRGILYADAEAEMIQALNSEGNLYTTGNDGHPVAAGYAAYARALFKGYWKSLPASR